MPVPSLGSAYAALGTAMQGGVFSEVPTASGYARVSVTLAGNLASGESGNVAAGAFGTATAPVTATVVGFFDASSGGNLLMWAMLPQPMNVASGSAFPALAVSLSLYDSYLEDMLAGTQFWLKRGDEIGQMNGAGGVFAGVGLTLLSTGDLVAKDELPLTAGPTPSVACNSAYVPLTNGAPVDVPPQFGNFAPMRFDPTALKIYVYSYGTAKWVASAALA